MKIIVKDTQEAIEVAGKLQRLAEHILLDTRLSITEQIVLSDYLCQRLYSRTPLQASKKGI